MYTEISILIVQEGRIWEILIFIASQVPVKVGQNLIYILGHSFKPPPVDVHLAALTCALTFKYMVPVTFQYFMPWTAHTGAHGVSEHYLYFALTIPWSTNREHTTGNSTLPILWLKFRDIRAYPLKSIQCKTVSWSIFLDTLYTHSSATSTALVSNDTLAGSANT